MLASQNIVALIGTLLIAGLCNAQVPKYNSYSAASATVYLDFDGQTVRGTAWNWDETINAKAPSLSTSVITEVFNRVAEDFRIFNLNITTDSAVFAKAPPSRRVRIIVTPTSEWYGTSAGVSFVNSFTWGDDTPAWVFTTLLENRPKYIAEAASHEIGHTLGLQHQSTYSKTCDLVAEYAEGKGSGEIGWAPIMGVGYYKNFTIWTVGASIEGCKVTQNDISVISKGFNNIGFRSDDHGNTRETASRINFSGNNFVLNGIINNAADRDIFRLVVPRRMRLKVQIIPSNVAANNSGANVDLFLTLLKPNGDTLGKYNPKSLLNAFLDTTLAAGTYYLGTDGTGNQNVSDYGSLGLYALTGSLENLPAAPIVLLHGNIIDNYNILKWEFGNTLTRLNKRSIEYSIDGSNYFELNDLPVSSTSYSHRAPQSDRVYYRIKVITEDENAEYSNVVSLTAAEARVSLVSNVVTTHVVVRSSGEYRYQLIDASGRVLGKGFIRQGNTDVPVRMLNTGVAFLKIFDGREQFHFKILKK